MSLEAFIAVKRLRGVSATERLLLYAMADYADRGGESVFPSVPTLAEELEVDDRTIQRTIRSLEERGLLVRAGMSGRTPYQTIVYALPFVQGGQIVTPNEPAVTLGVTTGVIPVSPDPVIRRSKVSVFTPLPPLDSDQVIRLGRLHEQMRSRVFGGATAPDSGWCDDLIRRGATLTDIEEAVDQTATRNIKGHGAFKYARTVLERRVQEREDGNDPDVAERAGRARGADGNGYAGKAQRGGLRVVGAGRAGGARVQGFDASGLVAIGDDDEAWYRDHPEDRPPTS